MKGFSFRFKISILTTLNDTLSLSITWPGNMTRAFNLFMLFCLFNIDKLKINRRIFPKKLASIYLGTTCLSLWTFHGGGALVFGLFLEEELIFVGFFLVACLIIYFLFLIGLDNLYEPNSYFNFFLGFHVGILIFYVDLTCIILSIIWLKISQK